MADRKATNKYYPPDWDPSKGSINKYRNSHPLRERAKKLHLGILVIRFEMPYNIWCEGCKNHIGTGVRYNAEKTKVGMYYTTPVYKFRMKCHLCDNYIEMQTDPGNLDYKIISGASRQERRWDPTDNGQVVPEDKTVSKQLASDPMFKLDHLDEDAKKMKDLEPVMNNLEKFQKRRKDDYELNSILRRKFRKEKKERKELEQKDNLLKSKAALNIKLLPESAYDREVAQLLRLEAPMNVDQRRKQDRDNLMSRPIFELTESGSVRRKFSSLERQVLCSKARKTEVPMANQNLRQTVIKGVKKVYDFNDLNMPSTSHKVRRASEIIEDKVEVIEEETEDSKGKCVIKLHENSEKVETLPQNVSRIDKRTQKTALITSSLLSPTTFPSQPFEAELQTRGLASCSKQQGSTPLIAYSDSDQNDSD
ncbi:coiled-coil domain-containing protein 130 homolog [Varroa jacobsoni]|uniref:coiled-coil domain-containing protein 130 homolog n=1 Tax=Varroa jacobsoni TaxID=62625 RepID=UPI000BF936E0|nr:coiled-coil domain-containing protein 130 homolog [Varroa jacobsoni]